MRNYKANLLGHFAFNIYHIEKNAHRKLGKVNILCMKLLQVRYANICKYLLREFGSLKLYSRVRES